MRHFSVMAAVAVALLAGGIAAAGEKPAKVKEKRICRVEEDTASRIGSRRICRMIREPGQGPAKPQQHSVRPAESPNPSN